MLRGKIEAKAEWTVETMGGRGKRAGKKEPEDFGMGDYMALKKAKLNHQFDQDAAGQKKSDLFKGVWIYVNGWTDPPTATLKRIMRDHGGRFSLYKSGNTTHVICSALAHSKMAKVRAGEKVVTAAWITDSLEAGRLLPEFDYLVGKGVHGYGGLDAFVRNTPSPSLNPDPGLGAEETRPASTSPLPDLENQPSTSAASGGMLKTTDPGFIADFYARSRLHHISTWGQERKDWIRREKRLRFRKPLPLRDNLTPSEHYQELHEDVVAHVDMDCFFVSVLLVKHPELVGRAVGVTHSTGRGKGQDSFAEASPTPIASCSYEARAAGVKNGMLLGKARGLCPQLQTLAYDFPAYQAASQALYETLVSYTLELEAVSCDELYLNLGPLCREFRLNPLEAIAAIRESVSAATSGCPVSAGLGPNKLVARMGTRKAKPNGQYWVREAEVQSYFADIPVSDLPGVGRVMLRKLQALNVTTCRDLADVSFAALSTALGKKTAAQISAYAKGVDDRKLGEDQERKSVSCEINYGIRLASREETLVFLGNLCKEVCDRMAAAEVTGSQVTLKLMVRAADAAKEPVKYMGHGMCDTLSRSRSLPSATAQLGPLYNAVVALHDSLNPDAPELRGVLPTPSPNPTSTPLLRLSSAPYSTPSSPFTTASTPMRLNSEGFFPHLPLIRLRPLCYGSARPLIQRRRRPSRQPQPRCA